MGVPIKYHNGTDWVLIDAGAIVDTLGNRITADNITSHTTNSGIHITPADRTNWNGKINTTEKGVVNGVAPLDTNGVIPDGYIKKGMSNGVASLGSDGKLPQAQKPFIYANDIQFQPGSLYMVGTSSNTNYVKGTFYDNIQGVTSKVNGTLRFNVVLDGQTAGTSYTFDQYAIKKNSGMYASYGIITITAPQTLSYDIPVVVGDTVAIALKYTTGSGYCSVSTSLSSNNTLGV